MANYEATRYDFDGGNLTDIQGINTGLIIPWSDATPPVGFLECDGSAVSRSTYSALFAVVGTTYGVGDGSTTFNLPNLQNKLCQGRSPTVGLATNAGSSTVSCSGNIGGSLDSTALPVSLIGPHSHPDGSEPVGFSYRDTTGTSFPRANGGTSTGNSGGGGSHSHNLTGLSFSGGNVNPEQKSLVLMYVIKT